MSLKKYVLWLIIILVLPIISKAAVGNTSSLTGEVKLYFFYENNCEECDKEKNWLEEYTSTHGRINVNYYNKNDNEELFNNVKKSLKIKKETLPLTIIGSNYIKGFDENKIIEILNAYQNKDYCNLVEKLENNEAIDNCLKENKNIYQEKTNNKTLIIVGISILSLIILGSSGYYLYKRRKNNEIIDK